VFVSKRHGGYRQLTRDAVAKMLATLASVLASMAVYAIACSATCRRPRAGNQASHQRAPATGGHGPQGRAQHGNLRRWRLWPDQGTVGLSAGDAF
jgi:hypothetical protein